MGWPGHKFAALFFAAVLLASLAGLALFMAASRAEHGDTGTMLAVFHPSTNQKTAFGRIILAGGKPVRPTWMPGTWIAHSDDPGFAGRLRKQGAIGAYTSSPVLPQLAGCFAYVDAKTVQMFAINQ